MTTSDAKAAPTPGGEQLSVSFAVYANQVVTGYQQVQALLDMDDRECTATAIEALTLLVESQRAMLQRIKALVS